MLTVVALLLLPFVFGMSVYRAYDVPRGLVSGTHQLNVKHPRLAAVSMLATYLALVAFTVLIPFTAIRMVLSPPRSITDLFSIASVFIGYPLVYLVFEWVLFYSVRTGKGR